MVDFLERNQLIEDSNAMDAARYRFQQAKGQAIQIDSIDTGSLEFILVVVPVSLWVLNKTLGRSIEHAWDESGMNESVKRIISRQVDNRVTRIANAIVKSVTRRNRKKSDSTGEDLASTQSEPAKIMERDDQSVEVIVYSEFEEPIPETYWEMFGKDFDYDQLEERKH
jgi:hypothetical protein